jgi:hypothetical protein
MSPAPVAPRHCHPLIPFSQGAASHQQHNYLILLIYFTENRKLYYPEVYDFKEYNQDLL